MSTKNETVNPQLDLTCKQIALGNFRLCPLFSGLEPKELIPTSTPIHDGITIICVETPTHKTGTYGKAIFQCSSKGIMNYTIAYLKLGSNN